MLTKFANNTFQYAMPGQTEVLNGDSINIIKELKEKDWPMPAIVTNETLKMEAQIADMVAH